MRTPPLGPLLVLTDRRQCRRPLVDVVSAAVEGGARALVLREKDLPPAERLALARSLLAVLTPVGGVLVVAGPGLGTEVGGTEVGGPAPGGTRLSDLPVHLSATDPLPQPRPVLVGRSCHDAGQVRRAADEACDWVTVSPVRATASKPGYGPALGTAGLAALTAGPPAYALGGLTAADARPCLAAGAGGLAVMGGVMRADDPARVVTDLLAELTCARGAA